jgi:enamine deaminase RidA (YjgF/YER057c/UK114 family)
MDRTSVPAGTKWDGVVGYSRAVRAGQFVFVSGTVGIDADGNVVGPGDAYAQMRQALANVVAALEKLGAAPGDVVRTRMYVTDIGAWEEVGRAHGEVFGDIRPATSMVEVCGLIAPELVVEVEADAVVA